MQLYDVPTDARLFGQDGGTDSFRLNGLLPAPMAEEAFSEISAWPEYAPSPIRDLSPLAQAIGIGALHYKDESQRLGIGGVQALGGAYAVLRLSAEILAREIGSRPALSSVRNGAYIDALRKMTVTVASGDSFGVSVAWGAKLAGCRCRIFVPTASPARLVKRIAALDAVAIPVDGDEAAAVRACAAAAASEGWHALAETQDNSALTRFQDILAGYSVVASEALDLPAELRPTHVFVQAQVTEMALALAARYRHVIGDQGPRLVLVQSQNVDLPNFGGTLPSVVQDSLLQDLAACLTVDDLAAKSILETLHDRPFVPVETSIAGLLGALGAASSPTLREALGIMRDSRILTLGNESLAGVSYASDMLAI